MKIIYWKYFSSYIIKYYYTCIILFNYLVSYFSGSENCSSSLFNCYETSRFFIGVLSYSKKIGCVGNENWFDGNVMIIFIENTQGIVVILVF